MMSFKFYWLSLSLGLLQVLAYSAVARGYPIGRDHDHHRPTSIASNFAQRANSGLAKHGT